MAAKPATIDPLSEFFAEADEVAAGLAKLEAGLPRWSSIGDWHQVIARLKAFAQVAGAKAVLAGWTIGELYQVHRTAPRARLDVMGAGILYQPAEGLTLGIPKSAAP
jgi:alkanesulfonate monooxygenase SsuD/methylene tetrahydromethanopterin reductase-like flavin-dependent oxidoreductase (luciferase family)